MHTTESVWDYPRPPRVEACDLRVRVELGDDVIADSVRALRVLETSHPPTIYIPTEDIHLVQSEIFLSRSRSFCEYKGNARYLRIRDRDDAIWFYPNPTAAYTILLDHWAFFPGSMDACYIGTELVRAQDGDFYGGWITNNLVGPFKGAVGTRTW